MNNINLVKMTILLCLAVTTCIGASETNKPIVWEIQSNKGAGSLQFNLEQQAIMEIKENSQGELIFKVEPENSFFDSKATFNAIRYGKLEGMFMSPQYWGGADPIFSIFGDLVAAWESPGEYRHWLEKEGGIKYLEEAYNRVGLKLLAYMVSPAESLVSSVPIAKMSDFEGQSMRTPPGMVADFFAMLGARPKLMSVTNVKKSLLNKRITIADYSNIVVNEKVGLYDLVKHTNYPGFHSMALLDFVVSKEAWDALKPKHQEIVLSAVKNWETSLDKVMGRDREIIIDKLMSQGVTLHKWNKKELKKARNLAVTIWKAYGAKSVEATEVVTKLMNWLRSNGNLE